MSNTPLPERSIIMYVEGERGTYPIYKDGYTESQMHAHAAAVSAAENARLREALQRYMEVYEGQPDSIDKCGEWFHSDEAKLADQTARAALKGASHE